MSGFISGAVWNTWMPDRTMKCILASLADNANDQGVAWPAVATIATRTQYTTRSVLATLERLEAQGWLLRTESPVSHRHNGYQIVFEKLLFSAPRAETQLFKSRKRQVKSVQSQVKSTTVSGEIHDALYGRTVINRQEPSSTHPLPLRDVADVEKNQQRQRLPGETKPQGQGHATARANATAWADGEAEATTRSVGQGSRGVRPAVRERAGLDGIDAALADEATRVLVACGMVPDAVTRRLRSAVEGALRLRVERARCSVAEAGLLAETRWREYRAATPELQFRMGPRRFFVEGEWLDPAGWPRDRKEAARRSEARVGVFA